MDLRRDLVCHHLAKWARAQNIYNLACLPGNYSDQPAHPLSLIRVFAVHMKNYWDLDYPQSA